MRRSGWGILALALSGAAWVVGQDHGLQVHQPVKYKYVFLEAQPREKLVLHFYAETNCHDESAQITEFSTIENYKDDQVRSARKEIRIHNIYATLMPSSSSSCRGERRERFLGSFQVPAESRRMVHAHVTFEQNLILKVKSKS